jgi:hypothetical protein
MNTTGIFPDLATAFDYVKHEIFLDQLYFMVFIEQLQTGSDPMLLVENKKWK